MTAMQTVTHHGGLDGNYFVGGAIFPSHEYIISFSLEQGICRVWPHYSLRVKRQAARRLLRHFGNTQNQE